MALSTNLTAVTREHFMPVLVDAIFDSNVLCHTLLRNADKIDGGSKIVVPIEYAENDATNSGFLAHNGGVGATASGAINSPTGQDIAPVMTKAEYDWTTAYNSIILSGEETYLNSGGSQVLSLLKARMSNAEKTIKSLFGSKLYASSPVAGELTSFNGVGSVTGDNYLTLDNGAGGIIEDLGTDTDVIHSPGGVNNAICGYGRALGGITSSASANYWNANVGNAEIASGHVTEGGASVSSTAGGLSFTDFVSQTNGVADGIRAMTRMYNACSIDADAPDLIITTDTILSAYETALQGNKRFEGSSKLADAGFNTLAFKGASVVSDSHCPAGHMYFINSKYVDFKVQKDNMFRLEDFKPLENQYGIQARIFWLGQLVCSNPRMMGVLCQLPTSFA